MTCSYYSLHSGENQYKHYQRKVSGNSYGSVNKNLRGSPPGREEDGVSQGLFTVHNGTLKNANALFWVGGSKVKVSRTRVKVSRKFERVEVGGRRGKITGFSIASRRRFMRKLAEVDRKVLPLFCTLTFPDEFHEYIKDPAMWKKVFKRFAVRFRRKFPDGAAFWRLELQTRKSGKYIGEVFPHFHLLVYGVSYVDMLTWLFRAWWEACGRLSADHLVAGTQVKRVDNTRHLFSYVSKYLAKPESYEMEIGRVWGVIQAENIPFVRAVICELTEREAVQLLRYLRRFAHIKGRDYMSLTVLLDAEQWWKNLDRLLYPT